MPYNFAAIVTRGRADLVQYVTMLLATISAEMSVIRCLTVLRRVRALESALRRLITVAARGVEVQLRAPSALPSGGIPRGAGDAIGVFPLFDPRRRVGPPRCPVPRAEPRIRFFDEPPAPPPSVPEVGARISPALLERRLQRAMRALERLPEEARRLARWRLRHPGSVKQPMRPGRAPGFSARARRDVIQVTLADLDLSARIALEPG